MGNRRGENIYRKDELGKSYLSAKGVGESLIIMKTFGNTILCQDHACSTTNSNWSTYIHTRINMHRYK